MSLRKSFRRPEIWDMILWMKPGRLAQVPDDLDIPVLCCGLRKDEKGNAIKEGSQVEIGGNERYVSMCRKHFCEAMR